MPWLMLVFAGMCRNEGPKGTSERESVLVRAWLLVFSPCRWPAACWRRPTSLPTSSLGEALPEMVRRMRATCPCHGTEVLVLPHTHGGLRAVAQHWAAHTFKHPPTIALSNEMFKDDFTPEANMRNQVRTWGWGRARDLRMRPTHHQPLAFHHGLAAHACKGSRGHGGLCDGQSVWCLHGLASSPFRSTAEPV